MRGAKSISNFTLFVPHIFRRSPQGAMGATTSSNDLISDSSKFVQQTVNDNCVVIFSKTTCGYCRMAKKVFEDMGEPFKAVELNQREDGKNLQEVLYQLTGQNTVPRVFINGQCIGGGSETKQLQKEGKLLQLIGQCSKAA